MAVFYKLCRIAQSSRAHRTESASVMGHAWMVADNYRTAPLSLQIKSNLQLLRYKPINYRYRMTDTVI